MHMKYLAMIQARCGSTRFQNKALKDICGKSLLQRVVERLQSSRLIDEIMVVTSIDKANLPILRICADIGVRVGVGSEDDVLDRYYQTARLLQPKYIIRITGDCPLIDAELIDQAIAGMDLETDYCSNTLEESFADGLDFEIMKYEALKKSWKEARHSFEREHVTQYIRRHPKMFHLQSKISTIGDFSDHRWTVDEPEDFELVCRIYDYFLNEVKKPDFGYKDVCKYLNDNPQLKRINNQFKRNEGLARSIQEDRIVNVED